MTLAEMQQKVSSAEWEMWMGLMLLEAEECPNCGVAARDMMLFETKNVHCPVCKHEYFRVANIPSTLKE